MEFVEMAGGIILVLGTVFCMIGGIGLLRFPDFYARGHACGVTDTLGAGLALFGMMLLTISMDFDYASSWDYRALVLVKLASISMLLLVTSPISGHVLAKAAFERGVDSKISPAPDSLGGMEAFDDAAGKGEQQ